MVDHGNWLDRYAEVAPYNFVPLASFVHLPDWAQHVSHDVPYADGLSGAFDLVIDAETPILVGGRRERIDGDKNKPTRVHFVRDTVGRPFIPGSTLRGLLRSTVEIASFGKLWRTDEHRRFGVRDLGGAKHIYQNRISQKLDQRDGISERQGFVTKVRTGHLRFEGGSWKIRECPHIRIEQTDLQAMLGLRQERLNPARFAEDQKRRRQDGENVGPIDNPPKRWTALDLRQDAVTAIAAKGGRGTACWLRPECLVPREDKRGEKPSLWYAKAGRSDVFWTRAEAEAAGIASPVQAYLVITGTIGRNKHREYLFATDRPVREFVLPLEVVDASRAIHSVSPTGATNAGLWQGWKKLLDRGDLADEGGIPVFFIVSRSGRDGATDGEQVEGFGFAQLPKLAYPLTVGDMIRNRSDRHFSDENDVAEAIFGTVRQGKPNANGGPERVRALRGRVVIGHAHVSGQERCADEFRCILAAPKPSYFPFYVEQEVDPKRTDRLRQADAYRSYLADTKTGAPAPPPTIRGWKRYRPAESVPTWPLTLPDKSDKLQSILHPLAAGSRFKSRVTFHNLRPKELGALIFALGIGDKVWDANDAEARTEHHEMRHALGMGKPYGFGTVRLTLRNPVLRRNDDPAAMIDGEEADATLGRCLGAFETEMDEAVSNAFAADRSELWTDSEQRDALALLSTRRSIPETKAQAENDRFPYPRIVMAAGGREDNDFGEIKKASRTLVAAKDLGKELPDLWRCPPGTSVQPEARSVVAPDWLLVGLRSRAKRD